MFRLHPLVIALAVAQGMLLPVSAATLKPFSPLLNDNKAGVFCVCNGSTQTLSGNQQFAPGLDGGQSVSIGELLSTGRIIRDESGVIGADRLDLGAQNQTVSVPDVNGNGAVSVAVYNSAAIAQLAKIDSSYSLPDYTNVNGQQYIDARVAQVSNGTINVDIGENGAATTASTNGWSMAAKQSQLFVATGSGNINWNSDNRISFSGAYTPYTYQLGYEVGNTVSWKGPFSVNLLDGSSREFNITNAGELKNYNNWLIEQLQSGNLNADSYTSEFYKALLIGSGTISYVIQADEYYDEITQPVGDRVALSADGPGAKVTLSAVKTLEVENASGGAVRASNGATALINGTLASSGKADTQNSALELSGGSTGINNGVINGGFFNQADGHGVDTSTLGYSGTTVFAQDSQFINNGVLNYAVNGQGDYSSALWLTNASGINNGNINLGVIDSSVSRGSAGVVLNTDGSRFVNGENGTLYLGRTPQSSLTDAAQDVTLSGANGTYQVLNSSVTNNGVIVLGSKTSSSVGMRVDGGPDALMLNNGVIEVNGSGNSAMLTLNSGGGGKVGNAGVINLKGDNVTGINVQTTDGAASAWSSGTINVYGTQDASLPNRGMSASGSQASIWQNGTLNLYGANVVGAQASDTATLYVGNNSTVHFNADNQTGYQGTGSGTNIVTYGASYDVSTAGSALYRLSGGTIFYPQEVSDVTLSGANSSGIIASGVGTTLFNGDSYHVNGDGATAVQLHDGAYGSINNPIELNGRNSVGALSASGGATLFTGSSITGSGEKAVGLEVGDGASLINQGQVYLTGVNNTGARLYYGGNLTNRGSIRVASGTGVDVSYGYGQYVPVNSALRVDDGIAALRVGNSGALRIIGDGQGNSSVTAWGGADTVLLDNGASWLEASDIILSATGSGSVINNRAATPDISLSNVFLDVGSGNGIRSATSFDPDGDAYINVTGGGTGYLFENADGSTTSNDLTIGRNYYIFVSGNGTGVRANTTGRVIVENFITIYDQNGGSAIVTSTASEVINRGSIFSFSTVAPVIDLRGGQTVFINEGNITTPLPETVVVAGGATNDRLLFAAGNVVGDINTGAGSDTVAIVGGTLNGSLTMGNGVNNQALVQSISLDNVSHITSAGGSGSTLSLSEIAARGGSFARDDSVKGVNLGAGWSTVNFNNTRWTLTDNLKLAHSTINIDGGSTLLAGNGVDPQLSGATADSLVVNYAGTLDLTNGTGSPGNTLTIDGSLVSSGGRLKLNSDLAHSDTLRVNGDVSGTTLIAVTPVAGAQPASAAGVSLVEVSGEAAANSFALDGGYLAAGPWRYDLTGTAPTTGSSWDYRLASAQLTDDRSSRAALVPQVPSYISAPVGLAYYSALSVDDLNKRLGELRHQQSIGGGEGAEMFLRYTGANLSYKTSQSFSHYGYDFDLDYSVLQVGGNLLRLDGASQSLRGGVAYTRGNTRLRPDAADGFSSTTFDSDSLALYGTWQHQSGLYLDGVLSYDWHRGTTDIARSSEVAKLKGQGWSASLESGYPLTFASGVRLEPQLQLMTTQLKMDSFTDKDNLTVSYDDYRQTIGRAGARIDRSWSDEGERQYTPYLRSNYYKGWGKAAKTTVGQSGTDTLDADFTSGRFGQVWETGVGGTVTFKNNLSTYAEADYRKEIDGNGTKGWRYNLGVRWAF